MHDGRVTKAVEVNSVPEMLRLQQTMRRNRNIDAHERARRVAAARKRQKLARRRSR